jgi:hypothetical protein
MIRYALVCEHAHEFEGWFGSSADYDDQHARGLMQCPVCGSGAVRKAIMAPAVAGTKRTLPDAPPQAMRDVVMQAASEARRQIEDNFDYVGPDFAKEARAIHAGKSEQRGIYGEASPGEVKALVEDGVPVAPMPPEPPAKSEIN